MKMSEFKNTLTKEMLIDIISRSSCDVCPFKADCQKSAEENEYGTCEEFLERYIEDEG